MGFFDRLKGFLGKKKELETFEQRECRECREMVAADIKRFTKYVEDYSSEVDGYRKQGVSADDSLYQSALGELQRFTYSLYETEKMYPFIRENRAEDIGYRNQQMVEFADRVIALVPEDSILRFHGTPIYFAEEILKSGKISSSADRFDGYLTLPTAKAGGFLGRGPLPTK